MSPETFLEPDDELEPEPEAPDNADDDVPEVPTDTVNDEEPHS